MNMAKRFSYYFLAFALCAVISLGSLSFFPKSFAVESVEISVPSAVLPTVSSNSISFFFTNNGSDGSLIVLSPVPSGNIRLSVPSSSSIRIMFSTSQFTYYVYNVTSSSVVSLVSNGSRNSWYYDLDGSYSSCFCSSSTSVYYGSITAYSNSLTFTEYVPPLGKISFWDFMSFYFPEMPHGYFDGNINVVDGSYNIDFPSDASISGAISQTGNDHYTWTWNHGTLYWNGETVQGEHEGWLSPDYQHQTPPNGDITQTAYANRLINLSLSDLDSVVNYTPAYNENSRFRCWSCVMDSSYVWFVSDTRNKITGSIVSVTSSEVSWKYEFSDPQGGNTIYPTWAIVFSPMGEVIQVLSPTTVSNKNTYTLSCSIGTLEQDQDTGIWSCDPLYHGFWFSNDSPPVANITHLNVADNKKYLANPVFGESAFQLQFLDSINRGIADINSNIQSLQSAMQSSISGQTSDFQNMDAPSAPQPSTSQMMDYFSKESAFSAPNTDEVFSGDIKSGHYWDGVTWWSTKFNDIIVSNQVIVAFTTAMLTLGLAVLIIGRRFSMR